MAFFIPAYLQKRLLRYALSRLELLDTDALDLASLDIAWGSRSTVELRDIGLRNEKLASVLQLPPQIRIEHTSVALVRLTVPADLYTSSIVVEVGGVRAEARVADLPDAAAAATRRASGLRAAAASRHHGHTDTSGDLPNAQDLARSFLEQEPDDEKEELQAHVAAQSVQLQQSAVSDDVDGGPGTGVELSLPAFLANFLKGIGDRLQVHVHDVSLKVLLDQKDDAAALGPVALVVSLDSLKVEQATTQAARDLPKESQGAAVAHAGRSIRLDGVRASLIAGKENIYGPTAALHTSQSAKGFQSPVDTWSPSVTESLSASKHEDLPVQQPQSLVSSQADVRSESPIRDSTASLGSRFADPDDSLAGSHSSIPHSGAGICHASVGLADVDHHDYDQGLDDSAMYDSSVADSNSSMLEEDVFRRAPVPRRPFRARPEFDDGTTLDPPRTSRAELSGQHTPTLADSATLAAHEPNLAASLAASSSASIPGTPGAPAALAESRIFSHEEAASIYMSVADVGVGSSNRQDAYVPGAWMEQSSSASSNADSNVGDATAEPADAQPVDNLHTAAQAADQSRVVEAAPVDTTTGEPSEATPRLGAGAFDPVHAAADQGREMHDLTLFTIDYISVLLLEDGVVAADGESMDSSKFYPGSESLYASTTASYLAKSSNVAVPGAFSSYADLSSRRRGSVTGSRLREDRRGAPPAPPVEKRSPVQSIQITAGALTSAVDYNALPFLIQVARKLLASLESPTKQQAPAAKATTSGSDPGLAVSMSLETLSIKLQGNDVADSSTVLEGHSPDPAPTHEALVWLLCNRTTATLTLAAASQNVKLEMDTVTLDMAGQRLVAFDRMATLSSSISGPQAPVKDLSVTCTTSGLVSDITIVTFPILCDLDFHKIDDTLSSYGGFSSLLELGSSIMSDAASAPPASPVAERQRTVRFDSAPPPVSAEPQRSTRLNVRLNGAFLTLRGRAIAIQYKSSAIKMVKRDAVLGVQIDDISVKAPYSRVGSSAFELNLRNFGLKYLAQPEEHDLSRLISLLTPSRDKFEEEDDFLLDTLVRQRKKGAAMRLNFGSISLTCNDLSAAQKIQEFALDLTRLSLTKYLPEESRPGMLSLGLVSRLKVVVTNAPRLGHVEASLQDLDFAHVGAPSLVAFGVQRVSVERDRGEALLRQVMPSADPTAPPMVMARMIGDELEPTVKVKLWNVNFEYSVPLAESLLGLGNADPDANVAADLTASLANLTDYPGPSALTSSPPGFESSSSQASKPLQVSLSLRDCGIALNPKGSPARALLVLTDARLGCALPHNEDFKAKFDLRKASLLLTNDASKLMDPDQVQQEASARRLSQRDQLSDLSLQGYVSMSWISAATVNLHLTRSLGSGPDILDVDIGDELLVLESCADSTATLGQLFGALSPALPPPKGQRYQTEVASVQDMMASFTGDAFPVAQKDADEFNDDNDDDDDDLSNDEVGAMLHDFDQFSTTASEEASQELENSIYGVAAKSEAASSLAGSSISIVQGSDSVKSEIISGDVRLASLPDQVSQFAKKWNSTSNRYVQLRASELAQCPIRVRLRDVHVIWNLYDGYDWEETRATIAKVVQEVQAKAEERRVNRQVNREAEDEDESVIGDFLFNSIYIGIPANHDPRELTQQINRDVDDMMTETGSHVSTTVTSRTATTSRPLRPHGKKLKLQRSKRHKMAFELRRVSADFFAFPPGQETQSSLDVRVGDLDIFDHVPTSTWKKFMTYSHDAGPREDKKPMVHLEFCDVRPIPELIASEIVLRVTVLPVRLHVDQDTLDFMTRFFEFNDSSSASPAGPPANPPYLQRVEVYPVPLKLDYKPKRVDYAGIRSGRANEFKNFFVLDGAEMVLKHAIIYGTSGFDKLHHSLEDVWMPDILANQLPSVLSGLNGVRTLVNVGAGVRDLVVVPIREYQKDGRIVRSISKGALAFARSTGGELTRFGAKLAVTAQTALQGAEDFLTTPRRATSSDDRDWTDADLDETERRAISHYADQPVGLLQGLRGAARSLERDLLVTRDVIVAISGEMRDSDSPQGAARVLARHTPTLVLRPMIGATRALGQTLMGAHNSVDPANRRRVEDVSITFFAMSDVDDLLTERTQKYKRY